MSRNVAETNTSEAISTREKQEEVKEDLFAKFRATEGSWECGICMVQNDSDKVERVVCGALEQEQNFSVRAKGKI